MTVTIRQIGPCFAGEVDGIDMRLPLTPEEVTAIHAGMDTYAILVLHNQDIDDEQQLAFTRSLGEIELGIHTALRAANEYRLPTTFADISNLDQHNRPMARDDRRRLFNLGDRLWHSDSSFKAIPAKYSLLHARKIPSKGGNTEFADMRAAYDALSDAMKEKLAPLVAEHYALYSRIWLGDEDWTAEQKAGMPPVRWRVVRTQPFGRKSLFIGAHANRIVGWPVPEGRMFLLDLLEHATQRQFVYRHEWRLGDLVIWDNRATLHRGRPYDMSQRRELRRTTTEDLLAMPEPMAAE